MPISGLVLTLQATPDQTDALMSQLLAHSQVEVGELCEGRLPVVVDTPDREADRRVWEWLNGLPGVCRVDVVFVHFDPGEALPASALLDAAG